ncbi:hypothetical protein M8C21_015305 [Ambrosia artemisiifolia]|uniref:UspA domain-containing protein n=1 Tax=Ambrosia artemisiifolia TaxID=4212 RepID=A0AAD5CPF1_AMBAR|nr:hypothetical protein M8C21_015305 [Ambrosia artemisiifolia]
MEDQKNMKKVMVAIDQSEYSRYALEWALQNLHESIANNQLFIYTVQPISDYSYLHASAYGATQLILISCEGLDHSIGNAAIQITRTGFGKQTPLLFRPISIAPELIRNIQENQKKVALSLLDQAKDLCNKYGITAETITEVGDPKDLICEAVEKLKVQLLVMGSSSRGALKRAFLGSVSNHCVQNVKCPVLVVKKTA